MSTCGCHKPVIHWSSDFNARVCQNCGVILTGVSEADEKHDQKILGSHDREILQEDLDDQLVASSRSHVLNERDVSSNDQITGDYFGTNPQNNVEEVVLESPFVHLRVHTHLSFLKATCKSEDLIKKCKENGMSALAKTEFGTMCGVPSFVKDCESNNIKPIIGVEFNVLFGNDILYPVTFIALNREGYKQLVKMTTVAWCERKSKKADIHILDSDIPDRSSGNNIIALVDIGHNTTTCEHALNLWNKIETYIEINSEAYIEWANSFQQKWRLPVVVTGNVLYTNEEDKFAYGIALKIGHHSNTYILPDTVDNWFKDPSHYGTFYSYPQDWVDMTKQIADRVEDYGLVNKSFIVPTYKDDHKEYTDFNEVHKKLVNDAWRGLHNKNKVAQKEYQDRLEYELEVMKDKKFSSYFLLIGEIVSWMKKQGIMVPFGRGSSVGSLVCYALDIITMDPIQWGVPFERFINSGRIDLPDIDTDISQERRPEVLSHIAEVHGKDRVAHIATYQTMALRAAIDNSGRALEVPHVVNRDLRKIIPDDINDWNDLDDDTKEQVIETIKFNEHWFPASMALTGTAKNLGCHAAGVVISNEALGELVPLIPSPEDDGLIGIQYDMHDCEVLGLLKLDMLGLRNIDIIQHTLDRVKERRNEHIDVYNLPPDDKPTYDLITSADYVSIFQLDSTGYRRLCGQLKPENFHHIMALNALFRPGPLNGGMTAEYVERRHGRQELVGWHPWLDDVLSSTYQVPVFQEQVMSIAKILAGFTDVEADQYRKAIGKKDAEKFAKAQKKFKEGALKQPGLQPPGGSWESLEAWVDDLLEKLAGYARYGWNIGHSCLKGDSLVLTCDRGWVPIKDVWVGEEVWSVREDTGNLFRNRVLNVINNGFRDTIRTVSSDGRSLVSTADHGFFTSKHEYKDASELILGDSLKMFNEGASYRYLDIPMTSIADGNEVPFVVRFNDFKWDYMMKGQFDFRSAEDAATKVPFKELMSKCSRYFSSSSRFQFSSNELVNTSWINENILFSKSSRDSNLTSIPFIVNIDNFLSDFGVYGNYVSACKSYLFNKSGESGWASFKREFFDYIFATVAFGVKVPNERLINIIETVFSFAQDTVLGTRVVRNVDVNIAIDTFNFLGGIISPFVTPGTSVPGFVIGDIHYIGASVAHDTNFRHNIGPSQEKQVYDVPYNLTIDSEFCEVWDLTMEQDPNYIANGFVVHNCGYGWITYVTAYLETHYSQEYYASLLDAFKGNKKKLPTLLRSILGSGKCKIVPPNVNESGIDYEVGTDNNIYMGLSAIRNLGKSAPAIIEERENGGRFTSFINFCQRLPSVNKTAKINLVKSGSFTWDKMLCDRDKIDNVEVITKIAKKRNKKFDGSKVSPFEIAMQLEGISGNDYTDLERTQNERESLNSFITGHPAAIYNRLSLYLERGMTRVVTPAAIDNMECEVGESVLVVGMVDYIYSKMTNPQPGRPSRPYLNISLSDNEGLIVTNVWWPLCEDLKKILVAGEIAMFECVVKPDKFRTDKVMLRVDGAINLVNGVPIQGVFRSNGDPSDVVTKIGGMVNNINVLGNRKYASIRGRITVPPHLLSSAVDEFGSDIKYLISMEAIDDNA